MSNLGWQDKVGARNRMEEGTLELAFDARSNSRLCCQIRVSDTLDGLRLHVRKPRLTNSSLPAMPRDGVAAGASLVPSGPAAP